VTQTRDSVNANTLCSRHIIDSFCRTQYHPVLLRGHQFQSLARTFCQQMGNFWLKTSSPSAQIPTYGFQSGFREDYNNFNHDHCSLLIERAEQTTKKELQTLESTNFVHSRRKTWNLLRKLGTVISSAASSSHQIAVNITSLQGPNGPKLRALRQKRKELTIDPELSADFPRLNLQKLLVLMEFTQNTLKTLEQGIKNGLSPFSTII
jgi:hypothetical protein